MQVRVPDKYYEEGRDARRKSARYFLKVLLSESRSLAANSTEVSCGQFCDGRNMVAKKSNVSCPRVFETVCRKSQMECRT